MELTVRVLCRPHLAPGFALAGLAADEANDAHEAAHALARLAEDPHVGVVLVEDELHRALPPELVSRIDRDGHPVVAPFPSPSWDGRRVAEEYVLEILRQAVGYRVKPR
jgi:vacuolar-type H+-ATPase subunit F/Vma7